ncbi:hypothetical protein GOB93_06220 [Acetobacter musti]|uniref:Uncharacterized protein n=1 Tax=Acetobacter musti TaxID=864732 RepID=A0ABX0JML4_9PROT|nr:hypothetical protein [Acetobacter musti]NHN84240.1 hypothetical protein [Acetobacter musti]
MTGEGRPEQAAINNRIIFIHIPDFFKPVALAGVFPASGEKRTGGHYE